MIKNILENLRLWKNKIRIWILQTFTKRIKHINIVDEKGKSHKVTIEKTIETVCTHSTLSEIAPTMWRCVKCPDVFFQVNYKVQLTRNELITYLETIATHLGHDFEEPKQ